VVCNRARLHLPCVSFAAFSSLRFSALPKGLDKLSNASTSSYFLLHHSDEFTLICLFVRWEQGPQRKCTHRRRLFSRHYRLHQFESLFLCPGRLLLRGRPPKAPPRAVRCHPPSPPHCGAAGCGATAESHRCARGEAEPCPHLLLTLGGEVPVCHSGRPRCNL
jgi:hypothetical protein